MKGMEIKQMFDVKYTKETEKTRISEREINGAFNNHTQTGTEVGMRLAQVKTEMERQSNR